MYIVITVLSAILFFGAAPNGTMQQEQNNQSGQEQSNQGRGPRWRETHIDA